MRITTLSRHARWLVVVLVALALALGVSVWPAAAAPDTDYYIGFTSDVHNNTTNLQNWLNSLKSTAATTGTDTLHHMVFGGDYEGWTVAATCKTMVTNTFTHTPPVHPAVQVVLVRGNHDTDSPDKATGLVYGGHGEPYAIYALDNTSSEWSYGYFKETDIAALDATLAGLPSDIPVFIVAHHPVHTYNGRYSTGAAEFATMVSKYPNAIVLWGHNHTVGDPWYGQVKFQGTGLPGIAAPEEIGFTYANMGAMNQGNLGANGMLATVTPSADKTTVKFVYSNTSGAVAAGSPYTLEIPKASPPTASVELDGDVSSWDFSTATNAFTTGSFSTGSGPDPLTLVGISWQGGATAQSVSSVVFTPDGGGSTVELTEVKTQIVNKTSGSGATAPKGGAAVYRWPAGSDPTGKTGTIKVTFSGSFSSNSGVCVIGVANFKGVHQTEPYGTPASSSNVNESSVAGTLSASVDSAASGLIFDVVMAANEQNKGAPTLAVATGQSEQWNRASATSGRATRGGGSTKAATGGPVTMGWDVGANLISAVVAVPLNPATSTPPVTHTITATAGAGGSIAPSGEVTVFEGAAQTFTITPDAGYEVDDVKVDGTSVGAVNTYTFSDVRSDHTISAAFKEYVSSGRVELDGEVYMESFATGTNDFTTTGTFKTGSGADRLSLVGVSWQSGNASVSTISGVTFTPTGGDAVALTEVVSQTAAVAEQSGPTYPKGGAAVYRLPASVSAGQTGTIKVTFSAALSTNSGLVVIGLANFKGVHQTTPLGAPASSSDKTGKTAINTGVTAVGGGMVFDVVMAGNETVQNDPAPPSLTPAVGQTEQWSDAPPGTGSYKRATRGAAGTKAVTSTGSTTMGWTAGTNLVWAHVAVPLNPADSAPPVTHTITATAGVGGSIAPSGAVIVDQGADQTFTITPDAGYHVDDVRVDGVSVGAVTGYEFKDITADHTIAVDFAKSNHPPVVGTVTVSPDPAYPGTREFTAIPLGFTDPDGDILTYSYTWTLNDEVVGDDSATIGLTVKTGDVVAVSVTASDGMAPSDAATASVTVGLLPVTYQAGWNLVASGPGADFSGKTLYRFNPVSGEYETLLSAGMEPTLGYWVWLEEAITVYIDITEAPLVCDLAVGWNLIGNCTAVPLDLPAGKYCYVYVVDEFGDFVYQTATRLQPGQGAWIWSDDPQSIQLAPSGP